MKRSIWVGLMAVGLVGAAAASEVRYVDEFDLSGASCGLGRRTLLRQSVDGHLLTVCGKVHERGFGSHSEGAVGFRTDGKAESFEACVAVDDDAAAERDLPDAAVYILPSGTSAQTYTRSAWHRLREKVRAGAAVILTKGEGMALSEFEETTGCRIESSFRSPWSACVTVPGFSRPVDVAGNVDVCLAATSAEVLLLDGRGRPFLTRTAFGRGKVVFVNCALKRLAVERNDCFRESDMNPAYAIYAAAVDAAGLHRLCPDKPPFVLMTEHETSRGERRVACLNLSRSSVGSPCSIAGGEFRILPSVK